MHEINITIHFKNDNIPLLVNTKETLENLKKKVSEIVRTPVNELSVYFKDRFLTDEQKTIEELKINENDTIFLKKKNLKVEPGSKNDTTKELLRNPMVKSVLKNPNMMQSMLKSLPGFEKQMKKNPEMKRMLNNPQAMEEFEKLADNPDYYEQQLKNIDIAMSKLENIPGGFNMMTSLTKEFRDPFSSMMAGDGISINTGSGSPSQNQKSLPNVWHNQKTSNPLVRFRSQIKEIMNFGFSDMDKVAWALNRTNGDVDSALELLYQVQPASDEYH